MDGVKQITEAIYSQIGTILPAFKPLAYVYFPEKNQFYHNDKGLGVSVGAASSIQTITCALSLTQTFNIVLTESYKATDEDDIDLANKVFELEDAISTVALKLYETNLGLPNLVFQVTPLSIDAPVIVEASQLIILNLSLNVQYRYSTL